MARRNGRKGDYLFTSYYSGVTGYASKMKKDYWGDWGDRKILERNLQEVATPLNDPYPVPFYSGPMYEQTGPCIGEESPLFIGKTNRPFPNNSAASQALNLDPGIGQMSVSCTFVVR